MVMNGTGFLHVEGSASGKLTSTSSSTSLIAVISSGDIIALLFDVVGSVVDVVGSVVDVVGNSDAVVIIVVVDVGNEDDVVVGLDDDVFLLYCDDVV